MKILHIISSGGMYGAEAVILNLSRTLNPGEHRSILGVFFNAGNPNLQLHEVATKEGIESHLIRCEGQFDRTVAASIRELVSKTGANVVHAHGYKADIYVYFALRGSRTPFVSTCHTWYDNNAIVSLYGWADRLVLRNYAGVVAVSAEVKQRLLKAGVREKKIYLIQNGIDLRPFSDVPPLLRQTYSQETPLVGLVGRLAPEKGVDIFLHAAARVLAQCPDTQFVVIGDGPDRETLQDLIVKLAITENVTMLGRQENMPGIYSSLDLMASASRQEGLPMAILEGMASSRALVATSVGEVPSIVLDGRTGVLVPPEDAELLAQAIIAMLHDPDKRKRLGAAARQLIEDGFSAQRMTNDYLRVYERVIKGE